MALSPAILANLHRRMAETKAAREAVDADRTATQKQAKAIVAKAMPSHPAPLAVSTPANKVANIAPEAVAKVASKAKPKRDRKAYMAEFMRKKRADAKAAKEQKT